MKVLIVGGGVSGLTLAAFLRQRGISSTVIEKDKKWRLGGFTIDITPNGLSMLDALSLTKNFKELSFPVRGIIIKNSNGQTITKVSFSDITHKYGPVSSIGHDDLHRLLRNTNKVTEIRMGTTVKSLKNTNKDVKVRFSNNITEKFDVVVGADGINSQIREFVQPKASMDYSGFTFWYVWEPKLVFSGSVIAYLGERKIVGLIPSKEKSKVSVYFSMPAKEHAFDDESKNIESLKGYFSDMGGLVPKILDNLPNSPRNVFHHDDEEIHLKKWYNGRIVLLGDALHALSPLSSVGASMAMEDAYVLSNELAAVPPEKVEQAFENYVSKRRKRIEFMAKSSKYLHQILNINVPLPAIKELAIKYFFGFVYNSSVEYIAQGQV